jgi:ketosteroid isomerase-like protein
MSVEANKQIVIKHFDLMQRGKYIEALVDFADDMIWWVAGSDNHGGSNSKQQLIDAYTHQLPSYFPNGFTQTMDFMFGEGDWVAVIGRNETERSGVGKRYSNEFAWVFQIKDGKVVMLREYFDTAHAREALFGK